LRNACQSYNYNDKIGFLFTYQKFYSYKIPNYKIQIINILIIKIFVTLLFIVLKKKTKIRWRFFQAFSISQRANKMKRFPWRKSVKGNP